MSFIRFGIDFKLMFWGFVVRFFVDGIDICKLLCRSRHSLSAVFGSNLLGLEPGFLFVFLLRHVTVGWRLGRRPVVTWRGG